MRRSARPPRSCTRRSCRSRESRTRIRAGHTYVKIYGNADPDLRLEATSDQGPSGIMGDTLPGPVALHAEALGVPLDRGF